MKAEKREKQQIVVNEIIGKLKEADLSVLVNYRGLTVEQLSELRGKLHQEGSKVKVYKNTLTKRAVDESKLVCPSGFFKEPIALVTSENDPVSVAKIIVDFAMRYGNPSIKSKLNLLKETGCENIIILPLYPQYAAATTATVCDEVYRSLMKMRWQPSLQVIPHYESEPSYINALIKSIEKKVQSINWKPDLIISSYHGIPRKYFDKGDPYHCYCHKTTRLIKEKYSSINIETTFQSRFGPQEWLTPYTDKTLESLPSKGVKNLLVICPGFASDCVETLEEIDIQGRESFLSNGGENFDLIPCLNDSSDHIDLFENLVKKYI